MAIEVTWYGDTHDIILVDVTGVWTWEEMGTGIDRCNEMFDSVSYPVYSIFDFSRASRLPQGALTNLRRLNRTVHPNSGPVALVGLNAAYRMIVSIFNRLYGRWVNPYGTNVLNTRAEASELFAKLRSQPHKDTP